MTHTVNFTLVRDPSRRKIFASTTFSIGFEAELIQWPDLGGIFYFDQLSPCCHSPISTLHYFEEGNVGWTCTDCRHVFAPPFTKAYARVEYSKEKSWSRADPELLTNLASALTVQAMLGGLDPLAASVAVDDVLQAFVALMDGEEPERRMSNTKVTVSIDAEAPA